MAHHYRLRRPTMLSDATTVAVLEHLCDFRRYITEMYEHERKSTWETTRATGVMGEALKQLDTRIHQLDPTGDLRRSMERTVGRTPIFPIVPPKNRKPPRGPSGVPRFRVLK